MIRLIPALAVLAALVALVATDADAGKRPKFQSAPDAGSSEKSLPGKRGGNKRRFKGAPAASSAAGGGGAAAGGVGPGWLPARGDVPVVLPGVLLALFDKCLSSVAAGQPLDTIGLVPSGDDVIDYDTPYTRQSWIEENGEFSLGYSIATGFANKPVRLCRIDTVRGRDRSAEDARTIDDGFVALAYDLMDRGLYVDGQHPEARPPNEMDENDSKYLLRSVKGNARGCRVQITFARTVLGGTAGLSMTVEEVTDKPCDRKKGDVGAG